MGLAAISWDSWNGTWGDFLRFLKWDCGNCAIVTSVTAENVNDRLNTWSYEGSRWWRSKTKGWRWWRRRTKRLNEKDWRVEALKDRDGERELPWDACPRFGKWAQDQRLVHISVLDCKACQHKISLFYISVLDFKNISYFSALYCKSMSTF